MFKKLIAPLQKVLLKKGICPGCTSQLSKAKFREPRSEKIEKVTCSCGRVYFYDNEVGIYRRALDIEI